MAIEFANSLDFEEIEKIILYGSVARGEDNEDSDIDIVIITSNVGDEFKIDTEIHKKVFNILMKTGEFISPMIFSKEHFEKYKDYSFYSNVNNDGVLIVK
ncbi:nucleotidyltransferase domain-containing protein [Methanobrevibacter curvatus]|uniref:nucleotidyltransferase domain-containing protein n=1 Tax=Methanobrevibacter curvatus TaxID=49547 RepID=UPI000A027C0B